MLDRSFDPKYLAAMVKGFRAHFQYTQENLATESGLSTRTIESIESGIGNRSIQTLKSLARAFKIEDVSVFYMPKDLDEKKVRELHEKVLKKTIVVDLVEINNIHNFLSVMNCYDGLRTEMSSVKEESAMEIASEMIDYITDVNDVWDDIPKSGHLDVAREFLGICQKIENLGYICKMGSHKQKQISQKPLVFEVGVMIIMPKDSKNVKSAAIQLEDGWQKVA